MYYTLYFPYTVIMYCSCTIFIYRFPVILFILLSPSCTVLVHILFVYCTLYFPYTVFMYGSCTLFIYCFPVILFILLSLSCLYQRSGTFHNTKEVDTGNYKGPEGAVLTVRNSGL